MSVRVRIDMTKFQRDFRARVARSKQSLPVITNHTAYDIAKVAIDATKRADRQDVEALGVVAYRVLTKATKNKSARLLKTRKIIYGAIEQMRMTAIYAAMLRKRGIDPKSIPAGEFETRVRKALAGRLKSIGFLASSFVPVLRKFAAKLNVTPYVSRFVAPTRGKPKGNARPATDGWKVRAEFEVSAGMNVENMQSRERVAGILSDAISEGFERKSQDWKQHAERELNQVWR